jgi:transcriptional regulator with XRE-family HTH domain
MNRPELADFLRRCRHRLEPADVGVPPGARRRTAGLRREEVAALAGMSTDYYARLEQQRSPQPSLQMLAALSRALRLTDDERDHLHHLSGHEPPTRLVISAHVRPGLLPVLDQLTESAAQVVSDVGFTLAQNYLAQALLGPDRLHRNFYESWFLDPHGRALVPPEDYRHHSRTHAADLRATAARREVDPRVGALIRRLRAGSAEFAQLWDQHEVAVKRSDRKRFIHPVVGLITLDCEVLFTPEQDQRLLVYSAPPGSAAHDQLQLLRVVGLQDLSRPEPAARTGGPSGAPVGETRDAVASDS